MLADGLYQLGVSAARQGAGPSGSVIANLMVAAELQVSVTTDRPSYRRFQIMTVTAVVMVEEHRAYIVRHGEDMPAV